MIFFIYIFARDVGFSGKTAAVIRHALQLLEDDVMQTQSQRNDCKEIRIQPKLILPHVLNLSFYSNQVSNLIMKRFSREAIKGKKFFCM